jgi:G3E family GTPase
MTPPLPSSDDTTLPAPKDARVPVIVVTGFLGSGKTTLLKKVLATPELSDSLMIVNEIGEIGIDHHLLEQSDDRTVLLDNGCLCCQLRGDLQELLVDITLRRRRGELPGFDRVIVETSGLADPGPVAQTLYSDAPLARDYRLAHVVALVDANNAEGRRAAPVIASRQVAAADLVIVTKTDLATQDQVDESLDWINTINGFARREIASHGDIDIALLAGVSPFAWQEPTETEQGGYLGSLLTPHPRDVTSFTLTFNEPLPRELFQDFLDILVRLRGADLLRVKGILHFEGEPAPVLVQGVCHVFDKHVALARGASAPDRSTLVFIVRALARKDIESLWLSLLSLSR